MVKGIQPHRRRKRIQPHPSHFHHHPTNAHSLNRSHSLPLHPTRAHRDPYPCHYPPYHLGPLQYTHNPTHYPCPTLQHTLPPCNPHPPSQLHLHLSHSYPQSHSLHPLPPHQPRRRHPFTDFITNTPLPAQWEPFTLDRYTGETDPDEHLKVYITHVALYTSQDAVFCKAFPTTLKVPALEWFTTLPLYSIDSFDALSHMFLTHFAGNRPHQTTTISLLGIRQEEGEPLRAFIDRFSKAALRTPHLNQKMILQCMALTLLPGPFANNLYLHPPASMHELKLCVADYVRMEEMQTFHTNFCNDYAAITANPTPPSPALIPDHESPANHALLDMLHLMSPDPASLMRPYELTSSRHHARRPLPPMLI